MISKFSIFNENKINIFKPKKIKKREQESISKGLFLHNFISKCNVIFEKKHVHGMLEIDGEPVVAFVEAVPQVAYNPLRLNNKCKIWQLVEHVCYREGSIECDAYLENNEITKIETNVYNLIFPTEVDARVMCHYIISQCLYHIEEIKNLNQEDRIKIRNMVESETTKMVKQLKDHQKIC